MGVMEAAARYLQGLFFEVLILSTWNDWSALIGTKIVNKNNGDRLINFNEELI